ncbi:hypothetical protein K2X30_11420 [bacterium]|jgi:hypothetical protein|nr:hypothetical protein [bacterium]
MPQVFSLALLVLGVTQDQLNWFNGDWRLSPSDPTYQGIEQVVYSKSPAHFTFDNFQSFPNLDPANPRILSCHIWVTTTGVKIKERDDALYRPTTGQYTLSIRYAVKEFLLITDSRNDKDCLKSILDANQRLASGLDLREGELWFSHEADGSGKLGDFSGLTFERK